MTGFLRFLTLGLVCVVVLTSQQMAMARGTMKDAAGQVVLCTGQGVQTVTLDHQGNPIEVVHICPDCALTALAHLAQPQPVPEPVVHMRTLTQPFVETAGTGVIPTLASARDPPHRA